MTGDDLFEQGLIPRGGRILVGVSGGADSTALLHFLWKFRHSLAIDMIVLHYDHALRRGSSRDRIFTGNMARALGLRFITERNAIRCPKGCSVEDFARQRRFDFFIRTAKRLNADAVVLAHTQDDLAETVLMRLLRGTGLSGLRSILPSRRIRGVLFLRPMLQMSRLDVEKFLARGRVKYVEDPSNGTDDFLRNRVRHRLLPYIQRYFAPAIRTKLVELAMTAAVDHDFLEEQLRKVLPRILRVHNGKALISRSSWRKLPQALRRMLLRQAVSLLGGNRSLTFRQLTALEKCGMTGDVGLAGFSSVCKTSVSDKYITLS